MSARTEAYGAGWQCGASGVEIDFAAPTDPDFPIADLHAGFSAGRNAFASAMDAFRARINEPMTSVVLDTDEVTA